jgi:hypothetical protein
MKLFNRLFAPMLALGLIVAMYSCNSNEATTEEPKKAEDTATTATPPPPPAFTPFDVAEISHSVKDYAKWRPFFDTDSVNRKASGLDNIVIATETDKPNNVLIVLNVSDMKKAKDFAADPRLKDVMGKAGVVSKPVVQFFHVIRFDPEAKEKQWVAITHKVKDFDAWLKVYDGEGTAKRASEGMADAVLARGVDDPNLVHIVFDIKDMVKAKAALFSEEKKNLMTSAGVEGKPVITFYQSKD